MQVWYLKQVKGFIPKLSISGSFFSDKKKKFTMKLLPFTTGGGDDAVVINRTNPQGYQ